MTLQRALPDLSCAKCHSLLQPRVRSNPCRPCSLLPPPRPACPPASPAAPQVQYQDKPAYYTAEQLMAMLLVDLKEIAAGEGSPVSECVLAVPAFYTEPERHAMLAAAQVRAGGRLGGRVRLGGCGCMGQAIERLAFTMPGGAGAESRLAAAPAHPPSPRRCRLRG
jgi:hypothetical protein